MDQVHFIPTKKGLPFRLPWTVGPFIVNTRQATDKVHKLLEGMNLLVEEKWAYNPYHII